MVLDLPYLSKLYSGHSLLVRSGNSASTLFRIVQPSIHGSGLMTCEYIEGLLGPSLSGDYRLCVLMP